MWRFLYKIWLIDLYCKNIVSDVQNEKFFLWTGNYNISFDTFYSIINTGDFYQVYKGKKALYKLVMQIIMVV